MNSFKCCFIYFYLLEYLAFCCPKESSSTSLIITPEPEETIYYNEGDKVKYSCSGKKLPINTDLIWFQSNGVHEQKLNKTFIRHENQDLYLTIELRKKDDGSKLYCAQTTYWHILRSKTISLQLRGSTGSETKESESISLTIQPEPNSTYYYKTGDNINYKCFGENMIKHSNIIWYQRKGFCDNAIKSENVIFGNETVGLLLTLTRNYDGSEMYCSTNNFDDKNHTKSIKLSMLVDDDDKNDDIKEDEKTIWPLITAAVVASVIIVIIIIILARCFHRCRRKKPTEVELYTCADRVQYAELNIAQCSNNRVLEEETPYATIIGIVKKQ